MHSWGVGGLNSIYRYLMCCVVFISVHVRTFQCGQIDRGSFGGRQSHNFSLVRVPVK